MQKNDTIRSAALLGALAGFAGAALAQETSSTPLQPAADCFTAK